MRFLYDNFLVDFITGRALEKVIKVYPQVFIFGPFSVQFQFFNLFLCLSLRWLLSDFDRYLKKNTGLS